MHGDLNALLHRIGRAKESGTELDIPLSKQLIVDCARNMQCKPRGHRFTANTRGFWEVIRIYGGPRLYNFLVQNLGGPAQSTVSYTHLRAHET